MLQRAASPQRASAKQDGPVFAAIDLGTNNCRLLVATPAGSGFRVLDSYSRPVRLGEGLLRTGELSAAAMDRAVAALSACAEKLGSRKLAGMRAVATAAVRQARNGEAFLERVREETGIALEVISPREEAELALEGCTPLLWREKGRRALLFDIGGGSTELIWVRLAPPPKRPHFVGYCSMPLGVASLAERFGTGAFSQGTFAAAVAEIESRLLPFEQVHCISREIAMGGVLLLGTSGTLTTVAGVVLGLPRYHRPQIDGVVLSHNDVTQALARLSALDPERLAAHPCVGADRVDFVLPGCAILAAIFKLWQTPRAVVADRGLREGMLLRMMASARRGRARRNAAGFSPENGSCA